MNHERLIDAYLHLLRNTDDKHRVLDNLYWLAFNSGIDAGIDLERGATNEKPVD